MVGILETGFFKFIYLYDIHCILIEISKKNVRKGPINNS